ncbi:MAG TPA: PHB depolymerase family esterase [Bacteroidales bacterium]|jgi:polyhydroxybutyrate depolymerase|nr:PHB depolymerase family esterase [Bacteroidales bacterium]
MINKFSSVALRVWSAAIRIIAGLSMSMTKSPDGHIAKRIIDHGGIRRRYRLHLPSSKENGRIPLVIILHGRGANAESMILLTRKGFNRLAERERFIAAYPDAVEMNWNDGRSDEQSNDKAHRENIDDVGFISRLIDDTLVNFNADPSRVYVTGISNGAIMAYRLACELSGRIAAIAPVDGNIPVMLHPECFPAEPVSVLSINNTADPVVPYEGGEVTAKFEKVKLGRLLSVEESIEFWIKRNRCETSAEIYELPDKDPSDGSRVIVNKYANIAEGTEVILYTVEGGGHTWPGGLQYLPARHIGRTCRDFDANEVIWDFFKSHKKKIRDGNG